MMRQKTLQRVIAVKTKIRDLAAAKLSMAERSVSDAQEQTRGVQEVIESLQRLPSGEIRLNDLFLRGEEVLRAKRALEEARHQEKLSREERNKKQRELQACARSLASSEAAHDVLLDERTQRNQKQEQQMTDEQACRLTK